MFSRFSKIFKKISLITVGIVSAAAVLSAGAATITQPQMVAAACTPSMSTDQDTDIIYGGLSGSTADTERASLKTKFDSNAAGNCYTDLQAVYGKMGLTDTMLNDTAGWTLGTVSHDGKVTTSGGQVVGTSAAILSRCWKQTNPPTNCQPSSAYTFFLDKDHFVDELGVYSHLATYFVGSSNAPAPVLIHINQTTGEMDFAVEKDCGNGVIATPVVPPKPKQSLQCVSLTPNQNTTDNLTYTFTATASAANVLINTYLFNFGNGQTDQVSGNVNNQNILTVTSTSQTYSQTSAQQTITITVVVSSVGNAVSASTCQTSIIIPPKQVVRSFVCQQLQPDLLSILGNDRNYQFTALVTATNDTPASYQFFFTNPDGSKVSSATQYVNDTTVNGVLIKGMGDNAKIAEHTFTLNTSEDQTYSASFVATSANGEQTVTNDANCAYSNTTPKQLTNTGPGGMIGLVAGTSILGSLGYQFVLRRRLS